MIALMLAGVTGHFAAWLGKTFGLLDFPDLSGGRKRHEQVTPLVGGAPLAAATTSVAVAVALLLAEAGPAQQMHLLWFGAAVGVMFLIGLADDRYALGPKIRLILAASMLLVVIIFAPDFQLSFLRFSGQSDLLLLGAWGEAFTLLCLAGLLNSVNMADGKNGLVISLGLIWSMVLWFRLPPAMLPVIAASATALAVLLWFNIRGRLFLGDGGSYAVSALYGLLAIYAYNHDFAVIRADDIAVMFAVPVFDTIRLMAVRALQGRSPLEGDRDHLHHHLHRRWGWPRGLIVYVGLVAVPNIGALLVAGTGLAWLLLSFAGYAVVLRIGARGAAAVA